MKKLLLVIGILVLLLVGLVILAPALLSTKAGTRFLMKQAGRHVPGELTIQDLRLSWTGPQRVSGFALVPEGEGATVQAREIAWERGLWALVRSRTDLGRLEIVQPEVVVRLPEPPEPEATRPEPAPLTEPAPPPAEAVPLPEPIGFAIPDVGVEVAVVEGVVRAQVGERTAETLVRDFELQAKLAGASAPATFRTAFQSGSGRGQVSASGSVTPPPADRFNPAELMVEGKWSITDWSLEEMFAYAEGSAELLSARGRLDGNLSVDGTLATGIRTTGGAVLRQLALQGGPLKGDQPRIGHVVLQVDAEARRERVTVNNFRVQSELLELSSSGVYGGGAEGELRVTGWADLAAIMTRFPRTLGLREGLAVEEGKLDLTASVQSERGQYRFEGTAAVDRLLGAIDGDRVVWNEPTQFRLKGSYGREALELEHLLFTSSFLRATARGSLNELRAHVTGDVAGMLQQVGQFVALQDWDARGDANLDLRIQTDAAGTPKALATLEVEQLAVERAARVVLPEGDLRAEFASALDLSDAAQRTLINPSLTWQLPISRGRVVTARLVLPAEGAGAAAEGIAVTGSVDLEGLTALLHGMEAMPPETRLSGVVQATTQGAVEDRTVRVETLGVTLAGFAFRQADQALEPQSLSVSTGGSVDLGARALSLPSVELITSAGRLSATGVTVSDWDDPLGTGRLAVTGQLDLAELLQAAGDFAALPPETRVSGVSNLELEVAPQGTDRQRVRLAVAIRPLQVQSPDYPPIKEEEVLLNAVLLRDRRRTAFQLAPFRFVSTPFSVKGEGTYRQEEMTRHLSADGTLTTHLETLASYLRALAGIDIEMAGKGEEPFNVRAQWQGAWANALDAMELNAGLHVERASAFGLRIASLSVPIRAHEGMIHADVQASVNEGSLALHPTIRPVGEEAKVTLPDASMLLENVALTPEMANGLLRLFHPIFKNASSAEGAVSLSMDYFAWPLDEAKRDDTRFAGTIQLHQVTLGTEGLLNALLRLAKIKERAIELGDREIAFVSQDGRIETSPFVINAGGEEIILSGSVGLDQSLDYVAQMPITEEMVGEDAYAYLQGTTVNVPIGGTLSRPQLSEHVLRDAVNDLVRQATRNLLREEAGKALRRLFE